MYDNVKSIQGDRRESRIFHVRQINNFIKAVLFQTNIPQIRGRVFGLDLCCGKGGDLRKWDKAGVRHVVGVDIATESLREFISRYRSQNPPGSTARPRIRFSADIYAADLGSVRFWEIWPAALTFDVVSCQFAIHYSFESEERARTMMRNAAERLKPGGCFFGTTLDDAVLMRKLKAAGGARSFGNDFYRIEFNSLGPFTNPYGIQYNFQLDEAVDPCPEFLVPLETFRHLGHEFGLDLILAQNLHEYFYQNVQLPEFSRLLQQMGTLPADGSSIPAEQWEICYLYRVFVFKKRGGVPGQRLGCDYPVIPNTISEINIVK